MENNPMANLTINTPIGELKIPKDDFFQMLSDHLVLDIDTEGCYEGDTYLTVKLKWQDGNYHDSKVIASSSVRLPLD
jgi:hypothetical protein